MQLKEFEYTDEGLAEVGRKVSIAAVLRERQDEMMALVLDKCGNLIAICSVPDPDPSYALTLSRWLMAIIGTFSQFKIMMTVRQSLAKNCIQIDESKQVRQIRNAVEGKGRLFKRHVVIGPGSKTKLRVGAGDTKPVAFPDLVTS